MQVLGTVNIGTNIEHADRVDASHHIYHSQTTITQGAVPQDDADNAVTTPLSSTPTPQIRLNPKKGMRIDLYRIILTMHHLGFFVSPTGASLDQQDVFAAFGNMLGDDFSKYLKNLSEAFGKMLGADFSDFQKNLSQSRLNNNDSEAPTQIFDTLKKTIEEYYKIK